MESRDRASARAALRAALSSGDERGVRRTIEDWRARDPRLAALFHELIAPALAEFGRRWRSGEPGAVAREHRAAEIIRRELIRIEAGLQGVARHGRRALIACVEGERHDLGAAMLAALLRSDGWDVTVLGADLPADELAALAADEGGELVVLCGRGRERRAAMTAALRRLRALAPPPRVALAGAPELLDSIDEPADARVGALDEALDALRPLGGCPADAADLADHLLALGRSVQCRREALSWTQKQLADAAGLDRTYISGVERGRQNLTLGAVYKIARALDTDLRALLEG